jgi:putative acetyltransferase
MIVVRQEKEKDRSGVFEITKVAFERDDEARLVDRLRSVIGYLGFVAELDGIVIGHLSFSPVMLNNEVSPFAGLAPVSVLPAFQRQGVGSRLIRFGLERCRDAEYAAVFVLGDPAYYSRFGFRPAEKYGISCEYAVATENFMLLEIEYGAIQGKSGLIKYDAVFAGL